MQLLVVSDLHLGKGRYLKNGQLNILEDFVEDDRFCEFIDHYSTGSYYLSDVHLVLNGDILNLIQVDVEGVFNHTIDDEITIKQLELVYRGHKEFFDCLKSFASRPNKKITYIIGNHDAGMAFPKAQKMFCELVSEDVEFTFSKKIHGIHIEHGHRFEAANYVSDNKYFIKGPLGEKILSLPWGSLFCISLLPKLKKERPYIDKVRPLSSYVKWCFFHDPIFFFRILYALVKYLFASSFAPNTRQNTSFKTTLGIIKEITIYPKYAKKAKSVFEQFPGTEVVIMGHSHVLEWRKLSGNKYYLNTGTWNPIPSIDAALHEDVRKLSYAFIDFHVKSKTFREVSVKSWRGKWRPFQDEISLTF